MAVALNNILAAPSFSTWIHGEPLDLSRMLYNGEKPRHLIFHVAHLDDAQRMFFITLLLEEVLSWTRKQTGTTSLRAILYFDEVYGYLPPHPGNPPSKVPLMTLFKQARAFGVGVLLATQNPVDLDYKALSNAGTWFVGKLQTDRDKTRLIEGLEGVAAESGTLNSRGYLETVISALGNRVFLLHDIHKGKPLLFQSRHVLSFLHGPMTRDQIALLMDPIKEAEAGAAHRSRRCRPRIRRSRRCRSWRRRRHRRSVRRADGRSAVQARRCKARRPFSPPRRAPPSRRRCRPTWASFICRSAIRSCRRERPCCTNRVCSAPRKCCSSIRNAVYRRSRPTGCWWRFRRMARSIGSPASVWRCNRPPRRCRRAVGRDTGRREHRPQNQSAAKGVCRLPVQQRPAAIAQNDKLELLSEPGEDMQAFQQRCRVAAHRKAEAEIAQERTKYEPKFAKLGAKIPEGLSDPQTTLLSSGELGQSHQLAWLRAFQPANYRR